MKIYIAGPMSGLPEFNRPAFTAAADKLRAAGVEVINPAEHFGGDQSLPWSVYMREGIAAVLRADCVRVLPGWENSRGAKLEVAVAEAIGIPVQAL
jgi:hypothetical protein